MSFFFKKDRGVIVGGEEFEDDANKKSIFETKKELCLSCRAEDNKLEGKVDLFEAYDW